MGALILERRTWPAWGLGVIRGTTSGLWKTVSLILLLSVTATIPILQFASFGYMLECASRIARGRPLGECFPGTQTAGRLLIVFICVSLSWLPVWLIAHNAYNAELIEPGSLGASRMRVFARVISVAWVGWVVWSLFRGGKLRHFLWPAPVLAFRTLGSARGWREAEDRLWDFVVSLKLPRLLWLGAAASLGALTWLVVPASMIAIALKGDGTDGGRALVGLIGAIGMWWVLLHLPFMQIHMAREGRFMAMYELRSARRAFRKAPFAFCAATWATVGLAIPLYLFRIESIPSQLWWILSLFFVMFMFTAKLCTGWALRRSHYREHEVWWLWRYVAWGPQVAVVTLYLGSLYIAKFALWEGAASIYLQHAFLPPVPFFIR